MRSTAVQGKSSARIVAVSAAVVCGVACAVPLTAGPAAAQGVLTRGGPGGYQFGGYSATVSSSAASATQSVGVVVIDTVLPYQQARAAGTGMVLTSSGEVLTNYHVVAGAGTISVSIPSTGQQYQATVVGSDPTDDVAVLQLTGASGLTTVTPDQDATGVGEAVTAVGNAGGTGALTAAAGTITSLTASVTAANEVTGAPETLTTMIQTTADVVAGDSGGPLVDAQGEVVGIDTAASTGTSIDGYAIPIANALAIVAQIRTGAETSTVQIGPAPFLGVQLTSPAAYRFGGAASSTVGQGAVVGGVVDGSAAAQAGLQGGAVITSLNGQTIASAADVSTALAGTNPGDQVSIAWTDSAGDTHTATVTLGASPVA